MSGPITLWQINRETMETVTDFIFLGSKITADGDCSHEIKRRLLLGRKVMTNLESTCRRCEFHCWVGKIPWRKKWQLAPVLSPGKFQGQRSLAGYGPPGPRESDTTEPVDSRSIGLLSFLVSVVLITTSKYLLIFMRRIDFVSGDQCLTS